MCLLAEARLGGLPKHVDEHQLDYDNRRPEQTLPFHSHSPIGEGTLLRNFRQGFNVRNELKIAVRFVR